MPTSIYVDSDTRVVEFVCDAKGLVFSGQQTLAYYFPTREALIDDLDVIEKFRAGDPFPPPLRTAARLDAGEFDALLGDRDARSRPITAAEIDALVKERDARSYPLIRSESTGNDESPQAENPAAPQAERAHNYDSGLELFAKRVTTSQGRISAKRLLPIARSAGHDGSDRKFRRLLAGAKALWCSSYHPGRPGGVVNGGGIW